MKDKLVNILQGKELTLKEIYASLPDVKKESIRATLNASIKKGILFERVSKGKYKLK